MGAFFLYQGNAKVKLDAVETLFKAKGFAAPTIQACGSWTLLHYPKKMVLDKSVSVSQSGATLFAVGTFAYKGLGLRASMERILADFLAERLENALLVGTFCILVCKPDGVTFITDRMDLHQVFFNERQTVFSSSFAAVLKAGPDKYRVNELAVQENALTGYVIGPDTTVKGISVMDERGRVSVKAKGITLHPRDRSGLAVEPVRVADFGTCVDQQLAELDTYFSAFRKLVEEAGGLDIGLSGGYDSRLLILMATKHFSGVVAHSHYHRTPTVDEQVAQQVTAQLGLSLNRLAGSKQPGEMTPEEFERNVDNTAAYADGRVFHDYSWLVYFRTRWYRESLLKDVRFGMNGLGGELYRNHWNQLLPSSDAREWLKARVLGQGVYLALPKARLDEVLDYILAKASAALGQRLESKISHAQMRRYFGELFSVYSAGVKIGIDNQLAYSLAPYLDYNLRCSSYRTLPHIGLGGRFEGEMIKRLNPTVAALTSSYGYPLDCRPPLQAQMKILARGVLPYSLQTKAYNCSALRRQVVSSNYVTVRDRLPLVRRAEEVMRSPCFGLVWDKTVLDEILVMRTLSIGVMLLKYEDCIQW